jgi:hypothetical protein
MSALRYPPGLNVGLGVGVGGDVDGVGVRLGAGCVTVALADAVAVVFVIRIVAAGLAMAVGCVVGASVGWAPMTGVAVAAGEALGAGRVDCCALTAVGQR